MGRLFDKVIECNNGNDIVVWKESRLQFSPPLKLVVRQSQEAIFSLNGKALDSFGPGSHELDLPQLPLLLSTLGVSNEKANSFRAEVFFFNLVDLVNIKWGTETRLEYIDPVCDIPVSIGASGTFSIAVRQPRKLLAKIVGSAEVMNKDDFAEFVRSRLQMNLKTLFLKTINAQSISVFDLEMYLEELSLALQGSLTPFFEQYGIELTDFIIETILLPNGDSYFEEYKKRRFSSPSMSDDCRGTATASQSFCSNCGYRFTGTERFCPNCGTRRQSL